MAIKRKNKDWSNLIDVFSSLSRGYETADKRLLDAIATFCEILKSENISNASKTTSGKVWGAKSLVLCFCETFDPILIKLFNNKSYGYQYLQKQQIAIPLLNQMQIKENSKVIGDGIDRAVLQLESIVPIVIVSPYSAPPSDWETIQKDAENLQLLARMISSIYLQLGYGHHLKWCSICFRMANNASKYCHLHSSISDDTAYRIALKIKVKIPSETHEKFQRQRSRRQALKNIFTLISKVEDIPSTIASDMLCVWVSEAIKNLVIDTQKISWTKVAINWDLVLNSVPHVQKRYQKNAQDFTSWYAFSNYTKTVLQNNFDNTTHPYWIFMMLAEAEIWLEFEDGLVQEKLVPKNQEIQAMISHGFRNRDIVNQLQVANSYVSELREKYNKNRTSN